MANFDAQTNAMQWAAAVRRLVFGHVLVLVLVVFGLGGAFVGCAASTGTGDGDDNSAAVDLQSAADRGDWPRVRALYRRLVVPELGDYYPGDEGVVWRGGWLWEKPAGKLQGVERVAVEVARHWRRIDLFPPGASESALPEPVPDLMPEFSATAVTRRPGTLDSIPALLALHRCVWLACETPDEVVETFETYARRWERAMERIAAAETENPDMQNWVQETYGALVKVAIDVYWWLPPPVSEPHRRLRRYLEDFLRRRDRPTLTAATTAALQAYDAAWAEGIVAPTVPPSVMAQIDAALSGRGAATIVEPAPAPRLPLTPNEPDSPAVPLTPANITPVERPSAVPTPQTQATTEAE